MFVWAECVLHPDVLLTEQKGFQKWWDPPPSPEWYLSFIILPYSIFVFALFQKKSYKSFVLEDVLVYLFIYLTEMFEKKFVPVWVKFILHSSQNAIMCNRKGRQLLELSGKPFSHSLYNSWYFVSVCITKIAF